MTSQHDERFPPEQTGDDGQEIVDQGLHNWLFGVYPHHPEHPCYRCALVREMLGRPALVPILARRNVAR